MLHQGFEEGKIHLAEKESDSEAEINALEQFSDPEEQEQYANALARKFDNKNKYKRFKRNYQQAQDYVKNLRKSRMGKRTDGHKMYAIMDRKQQLFQLVSGNSASSNLARPSMSSPSQPNPQKKVCFHCRADEHLLISFCWHLSAF